MQKTAAFKEDTATEDETEAVRAYYNVLNELLSIADIEKLYIPPMLNEWVGLYGNQLLIEQFIFNELNLQEEKMKRPAHILDMGCGRGRIAYEFASKLMKKGGKVSGYNIDPNQVQNAIDWAK